jgi:flagellin
MALSILNNISALAAENQLSLTQTSLQKTLAQLSSGQRINSGADDAAGLAIANGLHANITALTQSVQNASSGIGMAQVADGALSQVTALLNRAVTLATEASNGTVQGNQFTAINTEYQNIVSEINSIGSNTYYNGQQVFAGGSLAVYMGDGTTNGTMSVSSTLPTLSANGLGIGDTAATFSLYAVGTPADGDTIRVRNADTGFDQTYRFKTTMAQANDIQLEATVGATLAHLVKALNATGTGVDYFAGTTSANTDVTASLGADGSSVSFTALDASTDGSDFTLTTPVGTKLGFSAVSGGGAAVTITDQTSATAALHAVNTAVATVAGYRGTLGAAINQVQAATNVINAQIQNLSSSEDGIMAADIPGAVANMTKYNILQQTGMAALSQSNQMQQAVLKLLQ